MTDIEPTYTIPKYQSKPRITEAVQLNWRNWNLVCEFLGDVISEENPGRESLDFSDACGEFTPYIELTVTTIHGEEAIVRHGDWILPEPVPGRFYPVKPDIFANTYNLVEE